MTIDIGSPAIVRVSSYSPDVYTVVAKNNPANVSGKITSVEIYVASNMNNVTIATFFVVSGSNLTTRDSQNIGTVNFGAKRTFEVNIDVEAGDYIGLHSTTSTRVYSSTSGGAGIWYKVGDHIPCEDESFLTDSDYIMSLYGIILVLFVKSIGGEFTATGSVSPIWKALKSLSGTFNSTGSVLRKISKSLVGVLSSTGTLSPAKRFSKVLSGVITFTKASLTVMVSIVYQKVAKAVATYTKTGKDISTYTKVDKEDSEYTKKDKERGEEL